MEEKARNAAELVKLKDNPSFQYLKLVVEKKRDKVVGLLAKSILRGEVRDQREIDYERGFWDGATSVINRPENAEAEFNAALKRLDRENNE